MNKLCISLAVLLSVATLLVCPHTASAQSTTTKSKATVETGAAQQKKERPIPFYGKIKAIDPAAKTLTVGSRIFVITSETKLMKRDKTPTTLAAGVVGLEVTGSYRKSPDGRLLANSIYFGPKTETEATKKTTTR